MEEALLKDLNILELIIIKINRYHDRSLDISDLIYDLECLLKQLITIGEEWRQTFFNVWLDIEVAYSLALDQELDGLDARGYEIVEASLSLLKKMADEKIKEFNLQLSEIDNSNA